MMIPNSVKRNYAMDHIVIFWTPRILSTILLVMVTMLGFSVIDQKYSLGEQILRLIANLIPAFLILIVLTIGWKHELYGGIGFIFLSFLSLYFFIRDKEVAQLFIPFLLLIIAALYIFNWFQMKKMSTSIQLNP